MIQEKKNVSIDGYPYFIPCSVVGTEVLPCEPTDLLSCTPLAAAGASPAGLGGAEGRKEEPMEFRRSTRFRRASRRLRLCISRRRQRSSSVSVGSELVRSNSSGAAGDDGGGRGPPESPLGTTRVGGR